MTKPEKPKGASGLQIPEGVLCRGMPPAYVGTGGRGEDFISVKGSADGYSSTKMREGDRCAWPPIRIRETADDEIAVSLPAPDGNLVRLRITSESSKRALIEFIRLSGDELPKDIRERLERAFTKHYGHSPHGDGAGG